MFDSRSREKSSYETKTRKKGVVLFAHKETRHARFIVLRVQRASGCNTLIFCLCFFSANFVSYQGISRMLQIESMPPPPCCCSFSSHPHSLFFPFSAFFSTVARSRMYKYPPGARIFLYLFALGVREGARHKVSRTTRRRRGKGAGVYRRAKARSRHRNRFD